MSGYFRGKIACPHCETTVTVRSSRQPLPTLKELQLQCPNVDCGATYGGRLEITHGIVPSINPNPAVHLRMVAPRRREADNDNGEGTPAILPRGPEVPLPRAANDDDRFGEAVATGT